MVVKKINHCPTLLEQDKPNTRRHVVPRLSLPEGSPRRRVASRSCRSCGHAAARARPAVRALRMQKARRRKLSAVALGSGCCTSFNRCGSWLLEAATHCFPLALPLALTARTGLDDVD